jgi:heme/copper-type cytochrome/quinol oxidase subunit 2
MGILIKGLLATTDMTNVTSAFTQIKSIMNSVLGILGFAIVGLAIFLAFKFFTASDEQKRKDAKGQMIYAIIGVVAIIIIVVLWNVVVVPALEGAKGVGNL